MRPSRKTQPGGAPGATRQAVPIMRPADSILLLQYGHSELTDFMVGEAPVEVISFGIGWFEPGDRNAA